MSMKQFRAAIAATLALVSAAAPAAFGAEFPKSGQAEFDTYGTWRDLSVMTTSLGKQGAEEGHGITRNGAGEGPFDEMAVHCLGLWTSVPPSSTGRWACTLVDANGDAALTTAIRDGDARTFSFVGGTGKYQGITGGGSFQGRQLHDAVGGQSALVVRHQVKWEIK